MITKVACTRRSNMRFFEEGSSLELLCLSETCFGEGNFAFPGFQAFDPHEGLTSYPGVRAANLR